MASTYAGHSCVKRVIELPTKLFHLIELKKDGKGFLVYFFKFYPLPVTLCLIGEIWRYFTFFHLGLEWKLNITFYVFVHYNYSFKHPESL